MKSFLVIGNRLEQTMRCIETQCKSRIILVHLGKVLNSAIYASRHDPCLFVWPATNKAQQWSPLTGRNIGWSLCIGLE